MAATELDIIRDEQERSNLLKVIADVETAMAVSTPGTRRVLENTVENARKRLTTLDKRIDEAKVEHAAEVQAQVAAAAVLAAKEAKLSAEERATYRGFLEEAYFTRKDFGRLEHFYAHSYDRLSEGGKDEMSHRVWEGVRQGEYEFKDLPKEMQEKEAKRLYGKLTSPTINEECLTRIPENDQADFVQAYNAGNRKQIGDVLARDTFRRNVAVETSIGTKHQAVNTGKSAGDSTILARNDAVLPTNIASASSAAAAGKFDSINLQGLTLTDSAAAPSAAAIPNANGTRISERSPA